MNALEVLDLGPIKGPFETLEIYADDGVFPVLGKDVNGRKYANPIKRRPTAWTVFFNGECGYVQVSDRILASRVDCDFLQEFKL
ncbi:MAG: hypothetical protein HC852_11045 [Acaryochloridaceae cyanobacterium RU_4_10]|nr:hypothetical protein [Acaryochloridaceae cyanobacterium RU_4_10]